MPSVSKKAVMARASASSRTAFSWSMLMDEASKLMRSVTTSACTTGE